MSTIVIVVFAVLMVMAVPVALAMVGSTDLSLWIERRSLAVIARRLYSPTQNSQMPTVPFFIQAISLMMQERFSE